jgi:hypothetical protein
VVAANRYVRGEPGELTRPGAQHRGRADHQRRSGLTFPSAQVQGDHLDGLAQSHVVSQATAQAEVAHPGQPGQPTLLVRPQRGRQSVRGPKIARCLGQGREPPGQRRQLRIGNHLHLLAVDLRCAGQDRPERLRYAHPGPRRAAQPLQQRRVNGNPPAAQPHQWAPRLGQQGDLLGIQHLTVEGQLPLEAEQGRQAEPGFRHLPGRRDHHRAQPEPVTGQLDRPQQLDARVGQLLGDRSEQFGQGMVGQIELARAGLLQQRRERWPQHRRAAQRHQQVHVRLSAEAGQHALRLVPQLGGVHDQGRIGDAAQLQHDPERRSRCRRTIVAEIDVRSGIKVDRGLALVEVVELLVQQTGGGDCLDPQAESGTGSVQVRCRAEPAGEVLDRVRLDGGERRSRDDPGRGTGPHQGVGDRVPELADQPLRGMHSHRPGAGNRERMGRCRETARELPEPRVVGLVQRPGPPGVQARDGHGRGQPPPGNQPHPGDRRRGPDLDAAPRTVPASIRRPGPHGEQRRQRILDGQEAGPDCPLAHTPVAAGKHQLDRAVSGATPQR